MNMNVLTRYGRLRSLHARLAVLIALFLLNVIAACTSPNGTTGAITPDPTATKPAPTATVAPPDPALAPPADLVEQPLNGSLADVPEVWLVPSRQSKTELAAHLMTDVARLDWVNPGLPEQVPPGTLIVIPPDVLARDVEKEDGNDG